ncbi:hypothetical protein CR513_43524, partial [Mucuna pruriens]
MSATIQDLKTQIRQLVNIVSHLQSARSGNLPSQTFPNSRGNASIVTLRSELRPTDTDSKLDANSQVPQEKPVPLIAEDVSEGGNQHSTPRCHKTDSQVRKDPKGIMRAQEEEDERGVELGGKCRNTTSTTREVLRPKNFLCPMHVWRQHLSRCHVGPRSFN